MGQDRPLAWARAARVNRREALELGWGLPRAKMGHSWLAGGPGVWWPVEVGRYLLKQRVTVRMMGSRYPDQKPKKAAADFFAVIVASPSRSPPRQQLRRPLLRR